MTKKLDPPKPINDPSRLALALFADGVTYEIIVADNEDDSIGIKLDGPGCHMEERAYMCRRTAAILGQFLIRASEEI